MKILAALVPVACAVLAGMISIGIAAGDKPVNHANWKHVQTTSGPLTTDKAFFDALDLTRPGLNKTKTAVDAGDYAAASEALATYYRERKTPRYFTEAAPPPAKHDPKYNTKTADAVLEDIFHGQVLDVHPPVPMGPDIDWNLEPVGDREWTWCLNRHIFWSTLADAYYATGDEKYARKFNELLIDWVHKATPPEKGMGASTGTWRTIECGIRMFSSWPHSYARFVHSPSFTVEGRMAYYKSLLEHARFLRQYPSGGNWLTMEMDGLLHIAILFPEFKEAAEWRQYAFDKLAKELNIQVYPDGAQVELTNSYHLVAQMNFVVPVRLARLNGIEPPAQYLRDLEKMYDFLLYSMKPNGGQPAFNDSDPSMGMREEAEQRMESRARSSTLLNVSPFGPGVEFFKRDDLRFAMTLGKEGHEPEHKSHAFPWAGQYIMRSGWDADARYLAFDAGPFGAGHQHEDKLGFELSAFGRCFIIDPGRYAYAASPMRHFCLGTASHSTAMIDGQGQARRRKDPKRPWVVKEPLPNKWVSTRLIDCAEGFYDEGYGPDGATSVVHRRAIVFVKPDYWVIADRIEGEGEHRVDTMFHFTPGKLELDEKTGTARSAEKDRASLQIVPAADSAKLFASIVEGQDDPVVQGWIATGYGKRVPAPTLTYTTTATLPATMAYLLRPDAEGSRTLAQMTALRTKSCSKADAPEPSAYCVEAAAGTRDIFLFGPGVCANEPLSLASDAEMAYVRFGAQQSVSRIVMLGGNRLVLDAHKLEIRLAGNTGPCDVEYDATQTRIDCSCDEARVPLRGAPMVCVNGKTVPVPPDCRNYLVVCTKATGKIEFAPLESM